MEPRTNGFGAAQAGQLTGAAFAAGTARDLVAVAATVLVGALEAAAHTHARLGADGLKEIRKNQFGETALLLDWEAEAAVIKVLRESGLPIRLVSEEHGILELTAKPELTVVLDGLDGSNVFKQARGSGRYCTMLGMLRGVNPRYEDYICGGIIQHSPEKLLLTGVRGGGVTVTGSAEPTTAAANSGGVGGAGHLRLASYPVALQAFGLSPEQLAAHELQLVTSLGISFLDVVKGEVDLLLDCTHKNNLEQVIAFGLIREAGGDIRTKDGASIARQYYHSFGQDPASPIPLLAFVSAEKQLFFQQSLGKES